MLSIDKELKEIKDLRWKSRFFKKKYLPEILGHMRNIRDSLNLFKKTLNKNEKDKINQLFEEPFARFLLEEKFGDPKKIKYFLSKIIKKMDFSQLPIHTLKIINKRDNYFLAEKEIDHNKLLKLSNFEWDLELGKFYQKYRNQFCIRWTGSAIEIIHINAPRRSIPLLKENEFYEDNTRAVQWDGDVDWIDEEKEIFILPFTNKEKVKILKGVEQKFQNELNTYLEIIKKEKQHPEFELDKVKKLSDLKNLNVLNNCLYPELNIINQNFYDNIFVIGDLHGSEEALKKILHTTDFFNKASLDREKNLFIFLGDYIDRGEESLWVLYHILKLKNTFPEKVILLKGNHEYYPIQEDENIQCIVSPADFRQYLLNSEDRSNIKSKKKIFSDSFIHLIFRDFFNDLQTAALIFGPKRTYLISHSGFIRPTCDLDWDMLEKNNYSFFGLKQDRFKETNSINDFKDKNNLEAMVWTELVSNNYKNFQGGIRKQIGLYSQNNFMAKFGIDVIIRGHEHPREGISHLGKNEQRYGEIYTLLSSGGFDDIKDFSNYKSGYLRIDRNEEIHKCLIQEKEKSKD
jgi:hypothetical protein